jgi:DNA-binding Lrp family transcriptional regulator
LRKKDKFLKSKNQQQISSSGYRGRPSIHLNRGEIDFDNTNIKILENIITNPDVKSAEIAKKINVPLSTIQRRRARIEKSTMLQKKFEVDTKKIGLRTADMLIKVTKGQIENVASEIVRLHSKSILEISVRIGQLDFNLVVKVVYKDSDEIYEIIKTVNTFDYVESVQWSEIVRIILRKENGLVENLLELSK